MARMMFKNLDAIVANTLTESIKMIDIAELHESDDNFFEVNRVEEFAETILGQGGVKGNLIVRPLETGGYEIISGHRRRAAVQYLLDRGENISRYLPCLVQEYADDSDRLLDIVLMNISARQISDAEMWKSYEIVDKILQDKKSAGEKFGRVREKLAEILGVSPAQVGKMQNVGKNAIPAVKEALESGDLSISTASEIAKMSIEDQVELLEQTGFEDIKHKDVKAKNQSNPKYSKPQKVDTCSTFSNDEASDDIYDVDQNDDSYESDANAIDVCDDALDVDAYSTSSKNDTSSLFSEKEITDKMSAWEEISIFIQENYHALNAILDNYMIVGEADENELIERFKKLLLVVNQEVGGKT